MKKEEYIIKSNKKEYEGLVATAKWSDIKNKWVATLDDDPSIGVQWTQELHDDIEDTHGVTFVESLGELMIEHMALLKEAKENDT
jgi:hypothetical protein